MSNPVFVDDGDNVNHSLHVALKRLRLSTVEGISQVWTRVGNPFHDRVLHLKSKEIAL